MMVGALGARGGEVVTAQGPGDASMARLSSSPGHRRGTAAGQGCRVTYSVQASTAVASPRSGHGSTVRAAEPPVHPPRPAAGVPGGQ